MEGPDYTPPKPPSLPDDKPEAGSETSSSKPIPISPDQLEQKQTTTKNDPDKKASPSQPQTVGDLVFQTMKDDLDQADAKPTTDTPSAPQPSPSPPPAQNSKSKLPLPPRSPAGEKVVMKPAKRDKNQPKRKKKGKGWLLLLLLLFLLVLAGATAAWLLFNPQLSQNILNLNPFAETEPVTSPEATVNANPAEKIDIAQILPTEASVIVQYSLGSVNDRSNVLSHWNRLGSEPSITGLLQGDPRLLLDDPEINEIYYVSLEKEPRPYLVAPRTNSSTQHLTETADARTIEQNGWYISHSLNTNSYTTALATETLADLGGNTILTDQTPATPMRVILGPTYLRTIRSDLLGPEIANGQLQTLTLALNLEQGNRAQITGQGQTLRIPTANQPSQARLLSLLPRSATFARLGGSFAADLKLWQETVGVLDGKFFNTPEVSALIDGYSTPYAFFSDTLGGGNKSYGLIIERAPESALTLDSPDLAQALTSLVPLLTGQPRLLPLEFNSGNYAEVALKFVNLSGSTQAIDVALTENYILIATSKDTMFKLIETVLNPQLGLSNDSSWADLLNSLEPDASSTFLLGAIESPLATQLLPVKDLLRFALTLQPEAGSSTWQANGVATFEVVSEIQNAF